MPTPNSAAPGNIGVHGTPPAWGTCQETKNQIPNGTATNNKVPMTPAGATAAAASR